MAGEQSIDSKSWTGGYTRDPHANHRAFQNPVSGSVQTLAPVTYYWRPLNLGILLNVAIVVAVPSLMSMNQAEWARVAWVAASIMAINIVALLALWWFNKRRGRDVAVHLDAEGLHLPEQFAEPVPWSRVGAVLSPSRFGLKPTIIHFDRSFKVEHRPLFVMKLFGNTNTYTAPKATILSRWAIRTDAKKLARDIERFRNNYCADVTDA